MVSSVGFSDDIMTSSATGVPTSSVLKNVAPVKFVPVPILYVLVILVCVLLPLPSVVLGKKRRRYSVSDSDMASLKRQQDTDLWLHQSVVNRCHQCHRWP